MSDVRVRPMVPSDLDAADRVFRVAFGTFLGLPDPAAFAGDADWIRTRFRAAPDAAFVAERDGVVVGSNLATRWGSVGFFGPLTVDPSAWDAGIGRKLLAPVLDCFARWDVRQAGLFTFAQSAKHVTLYQRHGFWPRFLTVVMAPGAGRDGRARRRLRAAARGPRRRRRRVSRLHGRRLPGVGSGR